MHTVQYIAQSQLARKQISGQDLCVQVTIYIKEAGVSNVIQGEGPQLPLTLPLHHPVITLKLAEEGREAGRVGLLSPVLCEGRGGGRG